MIYITDLTPAPPLPTSFARFYLQVEGRGAAQQRLFYILYFIFSAALFSACSDWRDGIADDEQGTQQQEIAFSGSVVSSQLPTRADATIVHLRETKLPATAASTFHAGIFGCYTGQYTWAELVEAYQTAYAAYATRVGASSASTDGFLASTEFSTFKDSPKGKAYTANMLYNAKATIGEDGSLTYAPLRLWPNNKLTSDATKHEYCTFWAYYPYNPTAEIGDYGISLSEERLGQGVGMGRVRFTMQPDAAQQNDFMISAIAPDCNRDGYPLLEDPQGTYTPKPVPLRFFHMLAQVRLYAYIQGSDRMVYQEDVATQGMLDSWNETAFTDSHLDTEATKKYFRKSDGLTSVVPVGSWLQEGDVVNNDTITADNIATYADLKPAVMNQYGTWIELKVGDPIPDESKCQRWTRLGYWDKDHKRRRAMMSYKMEFNNIKTTTIFYPEYSGSAVSIAYEPATTLGSATVNDYIMNPYWFHFNDKGERDYLSDEYMFGIFEEQAAAKAPENNALSYTLGEKNRVDRTKPDNETNHYNFAPGNILLVVPQKLDDDDVPHIVLTAVGPKEGTEGTTNKVEYSARLTINMLKMNIDWKSGYIYCYAILDDLRPGDDIVRGPESITTIFDTSQYTDQW